MMFLEWETPVHYYKLFSNSLINKIMRTFLKTIRRKVEKGNTLPWSNFLKIKLWHVTVCIHIRDHHETMNLRSVRILWRIIPFLASAGNRTTAFHPVAYSLYRLTYPVPWGDIGNAKQNSCCTPGGERLNTDIAQCTLWRNLLYMILYVTERWVLATEEVRRMKRE
jgi:hypothetical protein